MARGRTARRRDGWREPPARRPQRPSSGTPRQPYRAPYRQPYRQQRRGPRRGPIPVRGLWRALGLTVVSTVLWGVAHLSAGRRLAGCTLMSLLVVLVTGVATVVLG